MRGLTDVGTATVATAGAGAPAMSGGVTIAAGIGTAAASTAAATAAVSATNASMNADGDLFKQIKTTATASYKATTSDESLKNIAIAGATAGLTAGIAEVSGLNDAVRAASAANAAGNSTTIANQIQIAFAESALSTVSSTAAQSAINGDSFSETLKHQGINILVAALSNVAAKNIGNAAHGSYTKNTDGTFTYHAPTINKAEQLILHAGLGATAYIFTGNDAWSGAVSGVTGEITGDTLRNRVENGSMSKQTAVQLAGLAGGYSSIITGQFSGQSDHQVAQNIWQGQRIGSNAAENNSFFIGGKVEIPFPWPDYDIHAGVQSDLLFREESIGTDGRGTNFLLVPEIGVGMYVYTVPHGHSPRVSTSLGYKNTLSGDYIRTHQGGSGFGYTLGISTAPVTKIPINVSVSIPEKIKK